MDSSSDRPKTGMTRRRFLACTAGAATAAALASLPAVPGGQAAVPAAPGPETDERVARLLHGAIEFHVHPAPDGLTPRKADMVEVLRDAASAGMRAVVMKDKSCGTGGFAQLANKHGWGTLAVGALTLDAGVGGFNPEAVEIELALGSKVLWMPTYSARNDPTKKKTERDRRLHDLTVLGDDGKLKPEVLEILGMAKAGGMVVSTGHLSRAEVFAVIQACAAMGVERMTVTHPLTRSVNTRLSTEDQVALARLGAVMEHVWVAAMPKHDNLPPSDYTAAIRAVGVDRCLVATDFGQVHNPTPLEGFRLMLSTLLKEGFTEPELERMVKTNPARLLGL
jgi:hypothetical protein